MNIDLVNAGFEFMSGFMVLLHCKELLREKKVAGVSTLATGFFAVWGAWNLYYYPQLDQMWSALGGLMILSANLFWLILLLKYRKNNA